MIKFTKLALAAALVAAPVGYAVAQMSGSGLGGSGVAGTGVDFAAGITTTSTNPGVALPGEGGAGGTAGGAYGDYGAVRGVVSLDSPATDDGESQ